MPSLSPRRPHAQRFKLQLCQDIRAGILTRRDAQKMYRLSGNLIQLWLTLFDGAGSKARPSLHPCLPGGEVDTGESASPGRS